MERLINMGFQEVGEWYLDGQPKLDYELKNSAFENVLYAFNCFDRVSYIGFASGILTDCLEMLKNGGSSSFSPLYEDLLHEVACGVKVKIFILRDSLIYYGGFRINVSLALLDAIVSDCHPIWNSRLSHKIRNGGKSL